MTVPLSDREQRILEEIEKNLHEEDPAFARTVREQAPRMDELRRIKLGAGVFAAGFVVLIAFFFSGVVAVGVVAFGLMVAGIVLVAGALRIIALQRSSAPVRRQRMAQRIGRWEERIRQRYKKP
jgi:Flp pilus assembly protein TadB